MFAWRLRDCSFTHNSSICPWVSVMMPCNLFDSLFAVLSLQYASSHVPCHAHKQTCMHKACLVSLLHKCACALAVSFMCAAYARVIKPWLGFGSAQVWCGNSNICSCMRERICCLRMTYLRVSPNIQCFHAMLLLQHAPDSPVQILLYFSQLLAEFAYILLGLCQAVNFAPQGLWMSTNRHLESVSREDIHRVVFSNAQCIFISPKSREWTSTADHKSQTRSCFTQTTYLIYVDMHMT